MKSNIIMCFLFSETEVANLTEKVKHLREIILKGDEEYIEEFNQKV